MTLTQKEAKLVKNIYDNCLGRLQVQNMDTSNFEDYEGCVLAFVERTFKKGKAQALADEIKWLKGNRDIIEGIDVLEVDKRLKKLNKTAQEMTK
jgi:hypothetical protein